MKRRSFSVERPTRLEAALRAEFGCTHSEALALVHRGAVYLQGRRAADSAARVGPGQKIMVVLEEAGEQVLAPPPARPALVVLFEDDDVLAVDKPPGVTAQPTPGRVGDSLLDLASDWLGYEAGLVHRLDRETSGVTVFGKWRDATSALAAEFREGRAQKEYVAVVASGIDDAGEIDLPLSKDPSRPGRWRATKKANGLSARTRFERIADDGTHASLRLYPETGRTHQLRAHLAALGFPIEGDDLYGGGDAGARCLLHARQLVLANLNLKFEAPVPEDMRRWFDAI